METKLHISPVALKALMLKTPHVIIKNRNHIWCKTYYMCIICQQRENVIKVGYYCKAKSVKAN